ncbi:MAG: hypothetical protein WDN29_01475 [Methylovirgula sp.]
MASNLQKLKAELTALCDLGKDLEMVMLVETQGNDVALNIFQKHVGHTAESFEEFMATKPVFSRDYQTWYSQALAVLKQLLPDRVNDFKSQYEVPSNRKELDVSNYVIADYLMSLSSRFVDKHSAFPRMQQQNAILKAAASRFDSSLFEIKQFVQADLFDSELEAAKHLSKEGFLRPAGAVGRCCVGKASSPSLRKSFNQRHEERPDNRRPQPTSERQQRTGYTRMAPHIVACRFA